MPERPGGMVIGRILHSTASFVEMGLVHEVLQANQMQPYTHQLCQKLIAAGPTALSLTKQLINDVEHCQLDNSIMEKTASWLTAVADNVEGQRRYKRISAKTTSYLAR